MTNLYSGFITTKNGSIIPVLTNGKSLESKYNPDHEAEIALNEVVESKFFIVTGISSGIFVKKLNEKYPLSKIICIERSQEDIDFLMEINTVKDLFSNKSIFFIPSNNIFEFLLNNYLPAKYGDIKIIERRIWMQENIDILPSIQNDISKAMGIVSADYSVQVHFGKIWQHNIMNNLKIISENKNSILPDFDLTKNVYVVAAGPSLDKKINVLKEDIDSYIISTDTAYSTLLKNNIIPDIVISIDGQSISYNHFINISNKTLFMFDLCSNSTAVANVVKNDGRIAFFKSGHPFSELANIFSPNSFYTLFAGSGTVTIASTDLAIKLGFKKIIVLGADFGYHDGKAYTKGTYFDSLYNLNTNKLSSNEKLYDNLMFRTELINNEYKKTTSILSAYEKSFEEYIKNQELCILYKNYEYIIESDKQKLLTANLNISFNYKEFIKFLKKLSIKEIEIPALPLIAWFKNNNKTLDYEELLKLAQSHILSYN